ncbi:MAG: DUF4936 family protein [Moraxellaceae bacterium]|nr:DUF4936 family protein [Moraxellaceae bacterium]
MAEHLYIYYRVAPPDEAAALAAVTAVFAGIASDYGVRGLLQRRHDDPTTWMELYSPAPPGLADAVARAALSHFGTALASERHVEHFCDMTLPALSGQSGH